MGATRGMRRKLGSEGVGQWQHLSYSERVRNISVERKGKEGNYSVRLVRAFLCTFLYISLSAPSSFHPSF